MRTPIHSITISYNDLTREPWQSRRHKHGLCFNVRRLNYLADGELFSSTHRRYYPSPGALANILPLLARFNVWTFTSGRGVTVVIDRSKPDA